MITKFFSPKELEGYYKKLTKEVSSTDFFTKPLHSKTQEIWCAAYFGKGYHRNIKPCSIGIDEIDLQEDFDFTIKVGDHEFPFQLTEIQEPNRRRGDEYKNGNYQEWEYENWEPGTENGPIWIREAIQKKIGKFYSEPHKLNLLVYVNFSAWEHNYKTIIEETKDLYDVFASIWLMNGNAICSLYSTIE
ncbi:MAG: hypothetical protein KKE44_20350, partial [Proteobacteria bacterium]|nr:hypothetical protein [Pseudomonadota bacterium]MBU1585084.1 hypothetical protein [Pseudomonadota bacterium]